MPEPIRFQLPQASGREMLTTAELELRKRAPNVKGGLRDVIDGNAIARKGTDAFIAIGEAQGTIQQVATWDPQETKGAFVSPGWNCGHHNQDRACKGCGMRFCGECEPGCSGAKCKKCGGPVWRDDEPEPPLQWNPANKNF